MHTLFLKKLMIGACSLFLMGCTMIPYIPVMEGIYHDEDRLTGPEDNFTYRNRSGWINEMEMSYSFLFSGIDTLWDLDSDGSGKLEIVYEISVRRGDFKIIFVDSSQNITVLFEATDGDKVSENGTITINIPDGEGRIRIVGRNASGEMKISLSPSENLKINVPERSFPFGDD